MNKKHVFLGLVIGAVFVYLLSGFIADSKNKSVRGIANEKIQSQVKILTDSATLLGNGSVTSEVDSIVPKCDYSDLTKYDTLLSSLDKGLSKSNIIELKSLFDKCGDNASSQRSVMALKLKGEVDNLENLVILSNELKKDSDLVENLNKWNKLAEKETEIAKLFSELVLAQEQIINTLLGNVTKDVKSVEEIRIQAEAIKNNLTTKTGEAAKLRSELI